MSFEGVNINKLQGGLGARNPSTDSVMMLMFAIPLLALPVGVTHYEAIELHQLKDLEDAGIDASFDANEKLLVHHAVSEFFRNAPNGVLHFVAVPDALTPVQLLQAAEMKAAIRKAKDVKGIAIGGTAESYVELDGMVEAVQAEINAFAAEKRLIDFVLLQGNGELNAGVPYALSTYPNLREKNAANVSVSIAQDPDIASLEVEYKLYADVGSVLGMIAVRKVNENAGSVDIVNKPRNRKGLPNYTLTGLTQWRRASLSDGRAFDSLSVTDQRLLSSKGYIYAGSFEGFDGVYLNGSPTCVEMASDYAYIENNRVWNKAARAIRQALLPHVRGLVKKDPATGYIQSTTIAAWEGKVNKALAQMEIDDEISGYASYIDPKQMPDELTPLQVKAQVVKDGIVHEFEVDLGLVNNI